MKTHFSFLFVVKPVSMQSVALILAASGISDVTISGVDQDEEGITFTANRHLTEPEKTRVTQAFMASIIQISDLS